MSYLASGLSTVSEAGDDARLEDELSLAVDFVHYDQIASRALELVHEDASARASRRARAIAVARARNTRALLGRTLTSIFPACRSQLEARLLDVRPTGAYVGPWSQLIVPVEPNTDEVLLRNVYNEDMENRKTES